MPREFPTAVIRAMQDQHTAKAFFDLLTLTHANLADPIRIVNNLTAIASGGDTYSPFPFSVIKPADDETQRPRLIIRIQDVVSDVVAALRSAAGEVELVGVELKFIDAAAPDTVLQTVSGYEISGVSYTAEAVSIEATTATLDNELWPVHIFTPVDFPALFA